MPANKVSASIHAKQCMWEGVQIETLDTPRLIDNPRPAPGAAGQRPHRHPSNRIPREWKEENTIEPLHTSVVRVHPNSACSARAALDERPAEVAELGGAQPERSRGWKSSCTKRLPRIRRASPRGGKWEEGGRVENLEWTQEEPPAQGHSLRGSGKPLSREAACVSTGCPSSVQHNRRGFGMAGTPAGR